MFLLEEMVLLQSYQSLLYVTRLVSINNVAMATIKVIFSNILDIDGFSHILDYVGTKFNTTILTKFMKHLILLFAHICKTYSPTRWWSKWESIKKDLFLLYPMLQPTSLQM